MGDTGIDHLEELVFILVLPLLNRCGDVLKLQDYLLLPVLEILGNLHFHVMKLAHLFGTQVAILLVISLDKHVGVLLHFCVRHLDDLR